MWTVHVDPAPISVPKSTSDSSNVLGTSARELSSELGILFYLGDAQCFLNVAGWGVKDERKIAIIFPKMRR